MEKTHPINKRFNKLPFEVGQHAEINACLGVDAIDLKGAEVYVFRVLKNDSQALAKPCKMCQNYLRSVGVKKVHYTTAEDFETLEL